MADTLCGRRTFQLAERWVLQQLVMLHSNLVCSSELNMNTSEPSSVSHTTMAPSWRRHIVYKHEVVSWSMV